MEDTASFILYSQYHGYWCPGDARSQGIKGSGIELVVPPLETDRLMVG